GHGAGWIELGGWYEPDPGRLRFDTPALALQLLRGLLDPAALHGLRARLAERDLGSHRHPDALVLQQIADALHSGALAVFERRYPVYTARAEVAASSPRAVLSAPPPRLSAPPPPADDPSPRPPVQLPEPAPLPAWQP